MEPMTLDEAKLIADCNRRLPGRASTGAPDATVVLAAALRESEARVEAAEKRAANARREAFEEAARVIEDDISGSLTAQGQTILRAIAHNIRALAPKPPAEPRAAEAPLLSGIRIVRHCNADNGLAVCTFEQGHDGPHSWPPPFDARRFAEALVEGLTAPHANVALRDDGQAVHIVREAVRRALDAGSSK